MKSKKKEAKHSRQEKLLKKSITGRFRYTRQWYSQFNSHFGANRWKSGILPYAKRSEKFERWRWLWRGGRHGTARHWYETVRGDSVGPAQSASVARFSIRAVTIRRKIYSACNLLRTMDRFVFFRNEPAVAGHRHFKMLMIDFTKWNSKRNGTLLRKPSFGIHSQVGWFSVVVGSIVVDSMMAGLTFVWHDTK